MVKLYHLGEAHLPAAALAQHLDGAGAPEALGTALVASLYADADVHLVKLQLCAALGARVCDLDHGLLLTSASG